MVYKLLLPEEWTSLESMKRFDGSPDDRRDGFVHLSTAEQVRETAARHFAGAEELVRRRSTR